MENLSDSSTSHADDIDIKVGMLCCLYFLALLCCETDMMLINIMHCPKGVLSGSQFLEAYRWNSFFFFMASATATIYRHCMNNSLQEKRNKFN